MSTPNIRRGLPRTPGGEPWPVVTGSVSPLADVPLQESPSEYDAAAPLPNTTLRQGLPRVAEGEAWPPLDGSALQTRESTAEVPIAPVATEAAARNTSAPAGAVSAESPATSAATVPSGAAVSTALRRGLPRVKNGEPWPPAVAANASAATPATAATTAPVTNQASSEPKSEPAVMTSAVAEPEASKPEAAVPEAPKPTAVKPEFIAEQPAAKVAEPAPQLAKPISATQAASSSSNVSRPPQQTAKPGAKPAATKPAAKSAEPKRYGAYTLRQWIGTIATVIIGLEILALVVVLAARGLLQLDAVQDFVRTYPGHSELPEGAPVGVPAWLGWQHFFNMFLMVLIIRSGLQVRRETKPAAFWSPKGSSKKVSLTIWFHQALDLLWLVNGLIFVVLLFATGQWMKIVPTSWDVFPNALSAGLQYASLDWPTENGWVNYNGLQLLAYFITVFIAAPLSVLTGFRMSTVWPEKNKTLNRLFPAELARKLHFPVMIYFVAFIVVHVALVFATGALRNLNHMFAAQGSADPSVFAGNWLGFWIFVASLVVIAGAWFAARPMVLAPIARLFGKVSSR
ncbi:cytochrome b/b6 domain-containing protein [Neomicrococcus lactis]|uniref:Thiosulfate reductase cytochrome b subunit n=1 Tax=Neomicrococcus lactis TaxID=732241 RepID=A0A7W8YBE3_9MICC|nr:cytochrome b/b6 domain-containing protein [Neomicrococcus lactis]MBB5598135.1 thiosulfate reductase cytochrome b subunit [Neomicrococcus lactis]